MQVNTQETTDENQRLLKQALAAIAQQPTKSFSIFEILDKMPIAYCDTFKMLPIVEGLLKGSAQKGDIKMMVSFTRRAYRYVIPKRPKEDLKADVMEYLKDRQFPVIFNSICNAAKAKKGSYDRLTVQEILNELVASGELVKMDKGGKEAYILECLQQE